MFNKNLNQEDLDELRKRQELINQHILIADALRAQMQSFVQSLLVKYKVSMGEKYNIDLKSGIIRKVESSKQQKSEEIKSQQ